MSLITEIYYANYTDNNNDRFMIKIRKYEEDLYNIEINGYKSVVFSATKEVIERLKTILSTVYFRRIINDKIIIGGLSMDDAKKLTRVIKSTMHHTIEETFKSYKRQQQAPLVRFSDPYERSTEFEREKKRRCI